MTCLASSHSLFYVDRRSAMGCFEITEDRAAPLSGWSFVLSRGLANDARPLLERLSLGTREGPDLPAPWLAALAIQMEAMERGWAFQPGMGWISILLIWFLISMPGRIFESLILGKKAGALRRPRLQVNLNQPTVVCTLRV